MKAKHYIAVLIGLAWAVMAIAWPFDRADAHDGHNVFDISQAYNYFPECTSRMYPNGCGQVPGQVPSKFLWARDRIVDRLQAAGGYSPRRGVYYRIHFTEIDTPQKSSWDVVWHFTGNETWHRHDFDGPWFQGDEEQEGCRVHQP